MTMMIWVVMWPLQWNHIWIIILFIISSIFFFDHLKPVRENAGKHTSCYAEYIERLFEENKNEKILIFF